MELHNSTLSNVKCSQATAADLSITINRSQIESIMTGESSFKALAA